MATSPCRPVGVQTDTTSIVNGLQCIPQRGKRLPAMLGDQPLGAIAVGIDNRNQVDPVGELADHRTVDRADHAGTDEGQPELLVGFDGSAHAYWIPSLVRMSVKAFHALVNSSGPDSAPYAVYSPR